MPTSESTGIARELKALDKDTWNRYETAIIGLLGKDKFPLLLERDEWVAERSSTAKDGEDGVKVASEEYDTASDAIHNQLSILFRMVPEANNILAKYKAGRKIVRGDAEVLVLTADGGGKQGKGYAVETEDWYDWGQGNEWQEKWGEWDDDWKEGGNEEAEEVEDKQEGFGFMAEAHSQLSKTGHLHIQKGVAIWQIIWTVLVVSLWESTDYDREWMIIWFLILQMGNVAFWCNGNFTVRVGQIFNSGVRQEIEEEDYRKPLWGSFKALLSVVMSVSGLHFKGLWVDFVFAAIGFVVCMAIVSSIVTGEAFVSYWTVVHRCIALGAQKV